MSVIISRALPNVDDGFKPVHRRILFAMYGLKLTPDKPYKKAARIVGEVIGKFHPHGDAAVYETITKMIQDFATNVPLIDGHGNFGSIDGDAPAAMRYTEIKLTKIAETSLNDLIYDTTDMVPNYDESEEEPKVLPGLMPNLLVNGSTGIAVGMATSIPPHNFNEVLNTILAFIDNPQITVQEIVTKKLMKGADFPTGAFLISTPENAIQILETGKGSYKIRAKYHIEDDESKPKIIIDEIPFQVNKSTLIKSIVELVKNKRIDNIVDLKDESNRLGIRIVIVLRTNANVDLALNKLFKLTKLQNTFSVHMLALHDNQPELMGLLKILGYYVDHQINVIVRKTKFLLNQDQRRIEILLGLAKALQHIDQVILLIKKSPSATAAQIELEKFLTINGRQAKAILEMKLQRLTALEQKKVFVEIKTLEIRITQFQTLLANPAEQRTELKRKLNEMLTKYGTPRRSEILAEDRFDNLQDEDMIDSKKVLVCITANNYIKRIDFDQFRIQNRGGVGIRGIVLNENDRVKTILQADTLDNLLFFTNLGKVYQLKVWKIPDLGRTAKGTPIQNIINVDPKSERVQAVIIGNRGDKVVDSTLFFVTNKGLVKRTLLENFDLINTSGKIAIKLRPKDGLAFVFRLDQACDIVISKSDNKIVRFSSERIPVYGRTSQGVIGVRFDREKDYVTGAAFGDTESLLVSISSNGKGKITAVKKYPKHRHGTKGVLGLKTDKKSTRITHLIASITVKGDEDLLIARTSGKFILFSLKKTRIFKTRSATGVRLVNLEPGEKISAVTVFQS